MADLIELQPGDVLLYKTLTPKAEGTLHVAKILNDLFGCVVILLDRREEIQAVRRPGADRPAMKTAAPVTTKGT